jgi:hypothetical protein
MTRFENIFWTQLCEFKDYQQQKRKAPESPWHRKVSKGAGAKHQNMVADRYKGRYTGEDEFTYSGELNDKIESIRGGSSMVRILSDIDIQHILNNYSTNELPKDKPKRIFAGVVVYFDPTKDAYCIKRDE